MTQWKPKQLVWEEVGGDQLSAKVDGFSSFYNYNPNAQTSNAILHEGISNVLIGHFGSFDDAKAACQADFERRWQAMSEPQPFWKPIEQCPKDKGGYYLIRHKNKLFRNTFSITSAVFSTSNSNTNYWCANELDIIDTMDATHYAEIPPLEASE